MFIARGSTCIIIQTRMQNTFRPNYFQRFTNEKSRRGKIPYETIRTNTANS